MPRTDSGPNREGWLRPQQLEYVPLDEELAVVRVVAKLTRGVTPPSDTALVAGSPHSIVRAPVLGSVTHRTSRRARTADQLLWRVTFALPLELLECPQALFALTAQGYVPTSLPDPSRSTLEALCREWELGAHGARLLSALGWRRVAVLGTTVAVAGGTVIPPATALAAAGHGVLPGHQKMAHRHHQAVSPTPKPAAKHPAAAAKAKTDAAAPDTSSARSSKTLVRHTRHGQTVHVTVHHRRSHQHRITGGAVPEHAGHTTPAGSGASQPTSTTQANSTTTSSAPSQTATHSHGHHRKHHHHGQASGSGLSSLSQTAPGSLSRGGGPDPAGSGKHGESGRGHHHHGRVGQHGQPGRSGKHGHAGRHANHSYTGGGALSVLIPTPPHHLRHHDAPRPSGGAASSTAESSTTSGFWTTGMGSSPGEVALLSHLSGLLTESLQPPPFLVPIYKAAASRFHLPWEVLAAINSIETDYGRNLNVSSAGAVGWMQFMPSTWNQYGISADGHGAPNPYNPTDAIFSAAKYLAANGGAQDLRKAIFAYNHAAWYVDSVMWRMALITDHAERIHGLASYALPLDHSYMQRFGRTVDGVTLEGAPTGASVYSMTPGVVSAVASRSTAGGSSYPVIKVTAGPLRGRYIYYRDVASTLVKVGEHVTAGQTIATVGHDAAGQGQIEFGFTSAQGAPINHPSFTQTWAPSRASMRELLAALVAERMLRMAHAASGGPYSVANHATAFAQTAVWLTRAGTDCSGFVSWLLGPRGIGDWDTSFATPSIPTAPKIKAGPGAYVTLWNNHNPGASGHVFIQVLDQWFESAGGVGIHPMTVTEAQNYIASGLYVPYHPAGL